MLAYTAAGNLESEATVAARDDIPEPKEIKLTLDNKTKEFIGEAERHFDDLVGQHDLEVCTQVTFWEDFDAYLSTINRSYTMKVTVKIS